MTIQERMVARSEREKDLLKYGRSQERERIIKLFEDIKNEPSRKSENWLHKVARTAYATAAIALIKGEK